MYTTYKCILMQYYQMQQTKRWHLRSLVFAVVFCERARKSARATRVRKYTLMEWLTTEQSYRDNLDAALNVIKIGMLDKKLITRDQSFIIFPQFEAMLGLSQRMIEIITLVLKEHGPTNAVIKNRLESFVAYFKVYSLYYKNHSKKLVLLQSLFDTYPDQLRDIQNDLRAFLKQKNPMKQNASIKDCLQQPLYRLFKYDQLLCNYLKKLPQLHPDISVVSEAIEVFRNLNNANNQQMMKAQKEQMKAKLNKLAGKAIGTASEFIVQMQVQTLQENTKLYIFNTFVLMTVLPSYFLLGQEKHYFNLMLTESSFVAKKAPMKYFQHLLFLCGEHDGFHLVFPDKGTRFEAYKVLQQVIRKQQMHLYAKRMQQPSESAPVISFTLSNKYKPCIFHSGMQIIVGAVEKRPAGIFSDDTFFITRFMLPYWVDNYEKYKITPNKNGNTPEKDNNTFSQKNTNKSQKNTSAEISHSNQDLNKNAYNKQYCGINQHIQIRNSKIIQLRDELQSLYPQIVFPQVDPMTKQINIFTKTKKNTKLFEIRSLYMQQFLNFIIRHPTIVINSVELARRLRIMPSFWSFACSKNEAYMNRTPFNSSHCNLCLSSTVSSVQHFFHLRNTYKREQFCFNFYYLLRNSFLSLPLQSFNTPYLKLLYLDYSSGRLDYSLLPPKQQQQQFLLSIALLRGVQEVKVVCRPMTNAGEVLVMIGRQLGVPHLLDFRIQLTYDGLNRLLDQDQYILDIVQKHNILCDAPPSEEQSFFSTLKKNFSTTVNFLSLKKVVYFSKEAEIAHISNRHHLITLDIFNRMKMNMLKLSVEEWGTLSAYYKLLFSLSSSEQLVGKVIPQQNSNIVRLKAFNKAYNEIVARKMSKEEIEKECVERGLRSEMPYYVSVETKQVPKTVYINQNSILQGECVLGVTEREVLVSKTIHEEPVIRILIEDITTALYPFSIHFRVDSLDLDMSFQGRMLYAFYCLLSLYKKYNKLNHFIY